MKNARHLITLGVMSTLLVPGAAHAQQYIQTESTSPWVSLAQIPGISGVTPFSVTTGSTDDGASIGNAIGFTFAFLGTNYTQFHVGTNGFIGFETSGMTSFSNQAFPNTGAPNALIAPWWDDLVASTATFGNSGLIGAAPNRVRVVEATGLRSFGGGGDISWQVWLYEGTSGRFEVRVNGMPNTTHSASVGYEGAGGNPFGVLQGCTPQCAASVFTSMLGRVYAAFVAQEPELTGQVGTFPRGAFPGDSATGAVQLVNLGVDTATAVAYAMYLSSDTTLDGSDILVGTGTVASIPGGNNPVTVTATVTVPIGTAVGDYRLLLFVDSSNRYPEGSELDNVVAAAAGFATGYDVEPTGITSNDGANPGDTVTFDVTVTNNGVPRVGSLALEVYASLDSIFDATDTLIVSTTVNLSGNNVENFQAAAPLPQLPPGQYFPIAVLDPADDLEELNELNNAFAAPRPFPTGPDFVINRVNVPVQATPGAAAQITTLVGSAAVPYSGPLAYRLYASSDEMIDGMDVVLGEFTVTFAGEDEVSDQQGPIFPASLPAGQYYIIALADPNGQIDEVSEMNNATASGTQVSNAFDFGAANVTVSSEAEPGEDVSVMAQLRSTGVPFVGDLPYAVFLSGDRTYDQGDERIYTGTQFVAGLSTTNIDVTFPLPRNAPVALLYAIVVADPDNTLAESNEMNNWGASTGQINILGADLFIVDITGPNFGFIGLSYPVMLTIENDGVADARGFKFTLHISENEFITITDPQIYVSGTATIASGGQQSFSVNVTLPTYTSTQTRFIGAIVDTFSQVPEDRETNNVRRISHPISVVFPIPDLTVAVVETATAASAGEGLAVTRILRNEGVAPAPSFTYRYYLSSNPTISTDDLQIGEFTGGLNDGDDDFGIDRLRLPSNIMPGTYYLGMIVDPDGLVQEVDETNNTFTGPQLRIYDAGITFITRTLPRATVGVPYEVGVYASGGSLGRTWTVPVGALPAGLSIDTSSGIIAGTPTSEGLFEFTLRAGTNVGFAEADFSIRVLEPTVPLRIDTQALATGIVGRDYRVRLVASGGAPPYEWSTNSDINIAGLTLTADGVLAGTPSEPGAQSVGIRVRDALGDSTARQLALNVITPDQVVAIEQYALRDAEVGVPYCETESTRFEASGGTRPYSWSVVGDGVSGMALDTDGSFCGTPADVGEFPLIVRAQDATGLFDTALFILVVTDGTQLAISTTRLADAPINQPYEATLTAIRGDEPYTWAVVDGTLPAGLAMDASTGKISGTPTAETADAFVVQVTDGKGRNDRRPLSIVVLVSKSSLKPADDGGCGCTTTPVTRNTGFGSSGLALLGLGVLLAARRRRSWAALLATITVFSAPAAFADPVPGTPYILNRNPITYSNLTNPTVIISGPADTNTEVITLPFTFKFYDGFFDTITVGVNGGMIMGQATSVSDFNPTPGTSSPNGFISAFWDDLFIDANQPGNVSYLVQGTAPQRTLTVQWRDVDRYRQTQPHMNFQVKLFEGPSGRIQLNYGSIGSNTSLNGTMAMEDENGQRRILFDQGGCTTSCSYTVMQGMENMQIELVQDPGIELVALGVTPPQFGFLGAPMPVTAVLANLHGAAIGPFVFAIEVSRTRDLANATRIYTSSPVTFPPFQTLSTIVQATPPQTLTEGEYYVGLVVDAAGAVTEVSEDNNRVVSVSRVRLLEGKPDLAAQRVTLNRSMATGGDSVSVYSTIQNVGSETVNATPVGIVLSTNPAISPQDVELARFNVTLAPGESVTTTTAIVLPASMNPGTYWIGALADPDDTLEELNESNNGRASLRPIAVAGGTLAIATARLPQGYVGVTYVALLSAVGGDGTYTWSVTSGRLPSGLGLVPSTGELFGRPLNQETQAITIEARSAGQMVSANLTLNIVNPRAPLTIVTRRAPQAVVGQEYTYQFEATGGSATSTLTWTAMGVPGGLSLSDSGLLTGTPAMAGSSTMAVMLTDGSATTMRNVQIDVRDRANLLIDPVVLPTAMYLVDYDFRLTATGGVGNLRWIPSGTLPEGVELAPDGRLSGAPARVGVFRFVVEVRDTAAAGLSARDSNTFELKVEDVAGFTITSAALPAATVNQLYDVEVQTSGGTGPFAWRIVQGRLPPGLAGEQTVGTGFFRIVGAAAETDKIDLLVQATDAHGRTAEKAFTLRIVEAEVANTGTMKDDGGCTCVSPRDDRPATMLVFALLGVAFVIRRRR